MGRLSKRVINRIKITITKKRQTMKKKLFKTRLLSFAAFCGLALVFASCANEDVAQGATGKEAENDKNLTTFVAGGETKTRTSMDYTSGNFYWEAGDYIYVKDDDGTWQKSSNAPTSKVAGFQFKVPGKFKNSTSYTVCYPGKNSINNEQVKIPTAQAQTAPNSTVHFGVSGDCGTATAGKISNGSFAFSLDHQAAYLVFQPYTSNTVLKDCYLTKIEVSADNDIAATYKLDPATGELKNATSTGKQIILTTKDPIASSTYGKGFPLNTTSANPTTNGAYMIIKPGTYKLRVRYWIKDYVTNVEGTITKNLGSFTYDKNTYYDMTADLNIRSYDGNHYYMWDAQKQYWDGWEWTKNLPGGQPTTGGTSSNYPKNNTDSRWYNDGTAPLSANTPLFQSIPNANELSWYVMYGDARYDTNELWTTMGHLHKAGVWLKKKSVLMAEGHYSTEKSADGTTDLRITGKPFINTGVTQMLPSVSDADKYFYVPALGFYAYGSMYSLGSLGHYWSSTATPGSNNYAYTIFFAWDNIKIDALMWRFAGYVAQPFE